MANALSLPLRARAILLYAKKHKFIAFLACLMIVGGGWLWYRNSLATASAQPRYVMGVVQRGTVVSSIFASGQISALNQLDVKSKASGEVLSVNVHPGQNVTAGAIIANLESSDAQKTLRDARINLENAQISFEKLKQPPTELSLTQAQNALSNAQDSLTKLYSDSTTHIINVFLNLPDIMTNIDSILLGEKVGGDLQSNIDYYRNSINKFDDRGTIFSDMAYNDYITAKASFDKAFMMYHALGDNPDHAAVENALNETYAALRLASKSVKSINSFVQFYIDTFKEHNLIPVAGANTALANLNTFTGQLNTHITTILSDINSLKQYKQTITERQQSLNALLEGANELDIRSAELSLTKAQNTLKDAETNLENYLIRAPFSGTIADIKIKKFDTVGNGVAVATLIANKKIAELSLNEVDVSKIKVGGKTTLTFDAIEGLTLTGKVAEIDSLGTIIQGVVSYAVKIEFDSQDERVKSGMTVNAAIITDVHQDVLTVPSSAIKKQNGSSYVQVFDPPLSATGDSQGVVSDIAPQQVEVEMGISDDMNTEIISGLKKDQQIVTRVITSTTKTTQQAPSLFGSGGVRAGGVTPR